MTDTLSVKVLRSTGPDAPATFQAFVVPCASRMSVLDVLTHIQSDHDSTLGFRYSCRAGMCGTCSMRVNGKNRWTCRTPAEQFRNQGLTLEPLPNYPVIRDLVVDMKPFFENYRKVLPQFVPQNPNAGGLRPDSSGFQGTTRDQSAHRVHHLRELLRLVQPRGHQSGLPRASGAQPRLHRQPRFTGRGD